mgnify:CR=1 FL=1
MVNASHLRVGPIRSGEPSSQPLSSPRDSALAIPANKSCLSQSRGNFKFSYSGYWFSSLPFHEINKFPAKIIIIEAESPDVFLASIVHQKKPASVVQSRWTDLIQYSDLPAIGAVASKKGFHLGGQCFFTNGCSRNFIKTGFSSYRR